MGQNTPNHPQAKWGAQPPPMGNLYKRILKWYNAIAKYSFEVKFINDTNSIVAYYLCRNHNEEPLKKSLIEIKFLQESIDPPKRRFELFGRKNI